MGKEIPKYYINLQRKINIKKITFLFLAFEICLVLKSIFISSVSISTILYLAQYAIITNFR